MTTIGVSVAVPEPWGSDLQRYRVELGDPGAAGIPTHITLLPPMEVEDALLGTIDAHLTTVAERIGPYLVRLRGTGTFRPVSPVVFIGVVQGISSCEVLASAVRRGPLEMRTQFPYHPHVTVAHQLDEALLDRAFDEMGSFDCSFPVEHFTLYLHDASQGWVPTTHYSLLG